MRWKEQAISQFIKELKNNQPEKKYHKINPHDNNIHLAIFKEPFLTLLLDKKKTIESRFSINKIVPFNKVQAGDIVLVKKSAGNITGFFVVESAEYYENIDDTVLNNIKTNYEREICSYVQPDFWQVRKKNNYATLIKVNEVHQISPFKIHKKDRSGWVVLNQKSETQRNEKEIIELDRI